MKRSLTFGAQTFVTTTAARDYIRQILHKYPEDGRVDHADDEFLRALLERHPRSASKIGCGIDHFTVRSVPPWFRNRAFYIIRSDGSETDFSFNECLKHTPQVAKFHRACRTAVVDQVLAFANHEFNGNPLVRCAITGELISRDECHIDHHEPSFAVLVETFISAERIDVNTVELGGDDDGATQIFFSARSLSERFAAFHQNAANLRITSAVSNLSKRRSLDQ